MSDEQTFDCERCGATVETILGCSRCGRLICTGCEAATDDDGAEIVCEGCFTG